MQELKFIIAKNIQQLRQDHHMTQYELAEKLNYSDKSISKWERGESTPDIKTLKMIADLFEVSLDYFVEDEHVDRANIFCPQKTIKRNRYIITAISIFIVAIIATLIFTILALVFEGTQYPWLCYAYAIPIAIIVWLVFNSVWFNPRHNFMIISLFIWSVLFALYYTFYLLDYQIWPIFFIGIPAQFIIIVWSRMKTH